MIINVKVNTSSLPSISYADGIYIVKCKAVRKKGKANQKVIKMLADYFNVAPSHITILKGVLSSIKEIQIKDL